MADPSPPLPIQDTSARRPVVMGTAITVALILLLGWYTIYAVGVTRDNAERAIKVENLRTTIIYLDEVLTMSSRMAAVTADLSWEARYRKYEPELDAAIQEAIRVVRGEIDRQAARRTDEANHRLVEMENQAFRFIRSGENEKARTVLFSTEYLKQKEIYARGMEDYAAALIRIREDIDRSNTDFILAYVLVSALGAVVLTGVWILVGRRSRARDAYMRSILDTAADAIITVDENDRILTTNNAAETMFGQSGVDLVGQPLKRILPDGERTGRRKDGTSFPVITTMSELPMGDRRITTRIVRDMTELEDRNSELERFAYAVSHDLKAPLVTIDGFLDQLKSSAEGASARAIERISHATDTMARRLEDLLELSKVGRKSNPPVEIRLSNLAREASELLEGKIRERGVDIRIQENLPTVFGDRPRLLEVYQNLIDNSVKYMGDAGRPVVEIGMNGSNGERVFFVRDNGMGIEAPYKEKVFQVFERLGTDGDGTGLGLALVKRIIEVHGGRIWVESEGNGKGSSFCFTLPRMEGTRDGER